jgi:hypothetical protein
VSYAAGRVKVAYIEPVAVGDVLPDMPLFLEPGLHVPVALEATYQATWNVFPKEVRDLVIPNPARIDCRLVKARERMQTAAR